MTEADWLTTETQPFAMLRRADRGLPTRKVTLLTCAACKPALPEFEEPLLLETVIAVELHADGCLTDAEYIAARDRFINQYPTAHDWADSPGDELTISPIIAVAALVSGDVREGCYRVINWLPTTLITSDGAYGPGVNEYRRHLCELIREIVGNPFRPWKPVPGFLGGGLVQPDGRTVPVSSAARGLAEGVAADLGFDRLPILADALEESGVTDAELLAHCRRPAGHVRGCWAVDVVLGRSS